VFDAVGNPVDRGTAAAWLDTLRIACAMWAARDGCRAAATFEHLAVVASLN
jgi:hypothetical protein